MHSYPNGRGPHGYPPSMRDFDSGSMLSYIPDDASSIHGSALGGAALGPSFANMFSSFTPEQWPGLPGVTPSRSGGRRAPRAPESVAGESVANSEMTDSAASVIGGKGVGQGGVSLGAGLHEAARSLPRGGGSSQKDRFKRYVEGGGKGSGRQRRVEDDEKSVSTAFQSQVGGGFD